MKPEFGNYYDNVQALTLALLSLKNGDVADALLIIEELRSHILESGERKSIEWLLPEVESALQFGRYLEISA
ncbi:MAG TPA: hypothetical protein VFD58_31285 [Blastocatellia bacterium]|nr:hypothetical protein [Blastocatellia bacterium]